MNFVTLSPRLAPRIRSGWPNRQSSLSAPNAAPRPSNGRVSARNARTGTRWNSGRVARRPAAPAVAASPPADLAELAAGELPRLGTGMGGAGPGPGRRPDSRLGDLARRRTGHRQIHAAAAAGQPRGARHSHAVPVGGGIRGADRRARPAARRVAARTCAWSPTPISRPCMARARDERVKLLIVDSIQTVQLASVGTAAGAITQLKECTAQLVRFAKSTRGERDHRRPRDQGRRHRRSARARAPGRHGAVFRE